MGSYKFTGLAAGSVAGDSVRYEQVALLAGSNLAGSLNDKRSTVAATATTTPLWAAGTGNVQDWTGTPTITNFPAAPQPGASRVAYPAAGTIFTDNANIDVQGDANYPIGAGDQVYIEALTTTTFKVFIRKKDASVLDGTITPTKLSSGHPDWDSTGLTTLTGTVPDLRWYKSNNAVDEKYWRVAISSNGWGLQTINDAFSVAASAYTVTRAANVVESHTWYTNGAIRASISSGGVFSFNSG
jgi:hypothetical protein